MCNSERFKPVCRVWVSTWRHCIVVVTIVSQQSYKWRNLKPTVTKKKIWQQQRSQSTQTSQSLNSGYTIYLCSMAVLWERVLLWKTHLSYEQQQQADLKYIYFNTIQKMKVAVEVAASSKNTQRQLRNTRAMSNVRKQVDCSAHRHARQTPGGSPPETKRQSPSANTDSKVVLFCLSYRLTEVSLARSSAKRAS